MYIAHLLRKVIHTEPLSLNKKQQQQILNEKSNYSIRRKKSQGPGLHR